MTKTNSVALFAILWLANSNPTYAEADIDIDPAFQETPEWCWVTVGEMVFRYYGVADINPLGNFQCGIIALISPVCGQNCGNCGNVPAGTLSTIRNMLMQYSQFAGQRTNTSTRLSASAISAALSMDTIKAEIDAKRPIIAGISPSGHAPQGGSEHVALIVGYDDDGKITVNDPFPFDAVHLPNPYTQAGGNEVTVGQYSIDRDDFEDRLKWRESIYHIRCSGSDCGGSGSSGASHPSNQYGRSCQTSFGRCGPFFDQPALPVGSTCHCGFAGGAVVP